MITGPEKPASVANYRTNLRPVSGLPLRTEELIAGLDGQLVPMTALAVIDLGLGRLSTHRSSSAGAPAATL